MPRLSVIIPVYNAEKYIGECLDSILNQTFKDIEVICVNDCSTDNSLFILNEYAKKDNRILVINNKHNYRTSKSRNIALKIAKGKYIHFIDNDDFLIDKHAYEKSIKLLDENNLDILAFYCDLFLDNRKIYQPATFVQYNNTKPYTLLTNTQELAFRLKINNVCWNKICKKDLLTSNNICFANVLYDDIQFTKLAFIYAKRAMIIDEKFIAYRRNTNTQITAKSGLDWEKGFETISTLINEFKSRDLYNKFRPQIIYMSIEFFINYILPKIESKNIIPFEKRLSKFIKSCNITNQDIEYIKQLDENIANIIQNYYLHQNNYDKIINEKKVNYEKELRRVDMNLEQINCCGCAACANICPKCAIKIIENEEGFYVPQIDQNLCVNCGLCDKTCPQINTIKKYTKNPDCYAIMADDETRKVSSSGGAFTVFATEILNRGGVVCGAAFDENWTVKHIIVDNKEDLAKLRGSKYVQSFISETLMQDIKKYLEENRWVLFTGTPCQVAGLRSYLNKDYPTLLCVDIICSKVPSKKVFDKFLNDKYDKTKIKDINFRDKDNGWKCALTSVTTDTNKDVNDSYFRMYHSSIMMCNSCNECKYATHDRVGDITIGDFWHIQDTNPKLNDNKGTSCVILNNNQGKDFFKNLHWSVKKQLPYSIATKGNKVLNSCFKHNPLRKAFIQNLDNKDFDSLVKEILSQKYKVGIINWWYVNNRGAILTNYALNESVKEFGYDVYTINYIPPKSKELFKDGIAEKFAKKYIKRTREISKRSDLVSLNREIGTFLVGSDQIFRYKLVRGHENIFYMDWVAPDKKLISCSASFGTNLWEAPLGVTYDIKQLLKRFDALSVREDDGVDVMKDIFNLNATQIIDPVFWIDKSKYDKILDSSKLKEVGDFFVDYFIHPSDKTNRIIEELKEKLNIQKVIHLKDVTTIEDFLWAIKNAKFLVGDSFHGTCFALIYNIPFAAVPPSEIPSRFKTLDRVTGLTDRFFYEMDIKDYSKILDPIDWNHVNNQIASEVARSKQWLKDAIEMPKNTNLSPEKELYECIILKDRKIAELENKLHDISEIVFSKKKKLYKCKYQFYRFVSNVTFGKLRKKMKDKKSEYKSLIK